METTRHFTATAYVVNAEATALHEHPKLDMWLPPGGHLARDELPHHAAIREVREETGLEVNLVQTTEGVASSTARPIPQPATIMLEDIDIHDGTVAHQHIDFIYYATASDRSIDPLDNHVSQGDWEWFDRHQLPEDPRLEPDVREQAIAAIDTVAEEH